MSPLFDLNGASGGAMPFKVHNSSSVIAPHWERRITDECGVRIYPQFSGSLASPEGLIMREDLIPGPDKCPVCGNQKLNPSNRQGLGLPSEPHSYSVF
jgi:hypothetical protein